MKSYVCNSLCTFIALVGMSLLPLPDANAADATLLFTGDFERGDLTNWAVSRSNVPEVQTPKTRSGQYALKSTLEFFNGAGASPILRERVEVSATAPATTVGREYWYGFSIYLPGDQDGKDKYVPDKYWEIVAQWYAPPDSDLEAGRNPPLTLKTSADGVGGRWYVGGKYSAKAINGKGDYDGSFQKDLGPYEMGKWTDWVFRVKWSYLNDGILEVWKDGKLVFTRLGAPTGFNDQKGPYFKMGIYKGQWELLPEDGSKLDAVNHRVIYHDEFRVADESGSYALVAPKGMVVVPTPPSLLAVD